ncbi:TetR/AcrR family transcriptional regulator [Agromyces cerinus]|uniref:Transcriptional regulator, TetR family n=1 Tax=Agromyces cerinus subsp. cerinus TaxID=232089 RepID=A0A1N6H8R3_9MICO|nr:TetR/AcrR family transcriptional regulator [Agromyces cerinus]SIO16057.1 transcriptional regulator, TetR family [Agromyces cerinus subsp. cerinus]
MPTPERTSLDAILAAGCEILEADGLGGLTMQAVADRVGVRAPSLYKRVRNRSDLVRLIAAAAVVDLGERLDAASDASDANGDRTDGRGAVLAPVARLARTVRAFAHERPAAYGLVFAPGDDSGLEVEALRQASAPLLAVAADLAGPEHALDAARTLTAWLTGFISMELSGAFRLGGDVDRAFEFGVDRIAAALAPQAE